LGLVYAFVDSGKTSFAMACTARWAEQLHETDEYIAYCGNEEAVERLRLRLVQAITGWTRGQIREDGKKANQLAIAGGLNNIKLFGNITTGKQIEYVLKEYKPYCLVIDQAPNVEIKTKKTQEGVAYLETLFKWYRKLCNIYDVGIMGVAQGTGEAEDTKYLKLSDIYGARVAIQGALDWAVGIGRKVNDPVDENMRYFNVPKNKLADGDGGRFAIEFDKYRCKYGE